MKPQTLLQAADAMIALNVGPREARMLAVVAAAGKPVTAMDLIIELPHEKEVHIYSMIHILRRKGLVKTSPTRGGRTHQLSDLAKNTITTTPTDTTNATASTPAL
jgi:hypothetical protein